MKNFENQDRDIPRQIPVWGHFFSSMSVVSKVLGSFWVQNAMQKQIIVIASVTAEVIPTRMPISCVNLRFFYQTLEVEI